MTDQEINIAIALASGWTTDGKWWSHPTLPDNGGAEPDPPDYCHDLNAMHEVEKLAHWGKYLDELDRIANPNGAMYRDKAVCHATARQRAEAFLRTIGKWKE